MKKFGFLLIVSVLMIGCFQDDPKLPQYYAKQNIDVVFDPVICYSGEENFDHFILTCSALSDSVHWYNGSFNQVYLGSGQPFELQNDPFGWEIIRCLSFSNGDTTTYDLELSYCARYIYIPRAFSPVYTDAVNDTWAPVINQPGVAGPYSIHIEVRTLDGVKVFESSDISNGWDGTYNGSIMSRGSYLFYIELTFSGEDPVEYTGWIELLG